jgi:acetyl-CoA carboxylase carboxyl transferase subunit alpha
MGLIDRIISEPAGGAHRDYLATMHAVKKALEDSLQHLQGYSSEALLERRFTRLMGYGKFKEVRIK